MKISTEQLADLQKVLDKVASLDNELGQLTINTVSLADDNEIIASLQNTNGFWEVVV